MNSICIIGLVPSCLFITRRHFVINAQLKLRDPPDLALHIYKDEISEKNLSTPEKNVFLL